MNIGKFSVKRPVTITMSVLILIMFGIVSFTRMSVDLMPKMELPMMVVVSSYEGAGPEEVEEKVTKPIESAMSSVSGLESVSSTSAAENSVVMLTFDYEVDLNEASNLVRDKIEQAKMMLPPEVDDISLIKLNMDSMPIMMIGISGDRTLDDVRKIVDDKIAPRLERIDGVASANALGGREEQVIITANPYKLSAYGLSAGQISQIVSGENSNHPGGYITQGDKQVLVRTLGQYKSVEELADTQVTLPMGGMARLGDIVDIRMGSSDASSFVTLDGKEVIAIGLQKESDGNTVNVDEKVREVIEDLDKELYDDIEIKVAYSAADMIQQSVRNVETNLSLAVFISMLVIFMFLGNFRSTIIIGVAIPISLISAFIMLYFGGYTLNMVTLAALAVSVGMVVDNSTVVLENIYRHRMMGKGKYQAAVEGTQEIVGAVVASTLTTVAVYLPFVFITDMAAQILVPFALTICFTLMASLIVSLTVVPMMSSKLLILYEKQEGQKQKWTVRFSEWFDKGFTKFLNGYQAVLVQALNHKKTTVLTVSGVLVASCCLIPFIGAELLPEQDAGQINISIELPSNTLLEETEEVAKEVEYRVNKIPEVEMVMNNVGSNGMMSFGGNTGNTASLIVMLSPLDERDRSSDEIANILQKQVDSIPGAEIKVSSVSMSSTGNSAISVELRGSNTDALAQLSDEVEGVVAKIPGAVNVENSMKNVDEEMNIVINREKATYYNISPSTVYQTVALALNDSKISKYRGSEDEMDIVLRYPPEMTNSLEQLQNLMIPSNNGGQVPLSEIAKVEHGFGQRSISRTDQGRTATISCDVYGRDMASVYKDIMTEVNKIELPADCQIATGGDVESMEDTFKDLGLMILMALLLVFMVMACQFESVTKPIMIMFSIPVMFIGVFFGLFITGQRISMMSLLGILMLEGIVVNNAIVLVDYVQILRNKGLCKREALVEAGRTRMRPILMTTLTTALAMIPQLMSTAEGSEIFKPTAATVIFGLLCSTIISLLVIPIVYEVMESWPKKVRKKIMKNNPEEEIDAAMLALEEGCWHDWEELQNKLEEEKSDPDNSSKQ